MTGKVCVVTGANSGIGYFAALGLAEMGTEVALVCRNAERGAEAAKKIAKATGTKPRLFSADMGLMDDVRRVADELNTAYPKIHVLLNNAGVLMRHREENAEGRELTFAINHLGPFLLTNLLLDHIKAAGTGRIVNVASTAHKGGRINFEDLEAKQKFGMWPVYSQSKLANVLFTKELARRLDGTAVTANALHPGVVATNLFTGAAGFFAPIISLFLISPEVGAHTSIYLATSPEVDGISGKYFARAAPAPTAAAARDMDVAARLWQVSEQMTGLAE
jgi:NAD(P)-dependent dehydrogenase (short-subunit alcohol dehydrogenase family)